MVNNCSRRSKRSNRSIRLNAFFNSTQCKLKSLEPLELMERLERLELKLFLMPWNTQL